MNPPSNGQNQPLPNPITDWPTLLQRFYRSEQQIQLMAAQLQSIQKQLDDLKSKPPLHVEYHFDQLKVNRLEGTLNVGITPQGTPSIESLETPGGACWSVNPAEAEAADDPVRRMQGEMAAYLNGEGAQSLMLLEQQYAVPLDEVHRTQVVDDVRRQLNERVRYYVTMKPYPQQGTDEEKRLWHDQIKEKTTRDIQGAFTAYLQKQKTSAPEGRNHRL
ncbi:spore germination protein GerPC [Cohnella yongneupensis]|uniref:Spore germination protein GerPC n=1 Tax=Cohnella yongneupensis TaxID=425006 RepID=A0ABW0R541_9BACL